MRCGVEGTGSFSHNATQSVSFCLTFRGRATRGVVGIRGMSRMAGQHEIHEAWTPGLE